MLKVIVLGSILVDFGVVDGTGYFRSLSKGSSGCSTRAGDTRKGGELDDLSFLSRTQLNATVWLGGSDESKWLKYGVLSSAQPVRGGC